MLNDSIMKDNVVLVLCLLAGALLWFLPAPEGLSVLAWHTLGIFLVTIVAVILKPIPMCASTLMALTVMIVTQTMSLDAAFSGFSSPLVWLLVFALFLAEGFVQTGLGRRIGLQFTRLLGRNTLGLSYGLLFTDLLLAPAMPSVTARAAGIVLPIMQGIATSYDSHPNSNSARKLGTFLNLTIFQTTVITSAMFMTAMAANPLLTELAASQGYVISWGSWALAASVPGFLTLGVMPLIVYKLSPPEVKSTPHAPEFAKEALVKMGPISFKEKVLCAAIGCLLFLWIFGAALHMNAVVAAMIGICILSVFRVLDWNSLLSRSAIWETLIWFSILLMMAGALNQAGVTLWLSNHILLWVQSMTWQVAFLMLALAYFYSHYLFASATAHVSAMFLPFLAVSIAAGAPPYLVIFTLFFFSSLFGGITHYSLGPAPVLLAAGYVQVQEWWRIGGILSIAYILIWLIVGGAWWKLLGYW